MSGHSKWATIKRKKSILDSKKAKVFTQMTRAVTVAAKKGGDIKFNFALRLAVDKAKTANVPKENIERAIKRGTGELEGEEIHENRYEGYGPHGVAFIVDTLTNNPNRTVADLKHIFTKHGGNLEGSVAWQFTSKGVIVVIGQGEKSADESWLLEAIDQGVEDVQQQEKDLLIITEPVKLQAVQEWLEGQSMEIESAELLMMAKDTVPLNAEASSSIQKLIDAVEEYDDVERVFHNAELS